MKTGVILPQAKECLWKRQGKVLPLQVSEGGWSSRHLDFGLLAPRTVRESISFVLRHPVFDTLLWEAYGSPRKLRQGGGRSWVSGTRDSVRVF